MNTIYLDTSNPNSTYNKYLRRGHSFEKEGMKIDARNDKCKEENLYLRVSALFCYEIANKWFTKANLLKFEKDIHPEMTAENQLGNFKRPKYEDFYDENNQLRPEFEGFYDAEYRMWHPKLVNSLLKKYIL